LKTAPVFSSNKHRNQPLPANMKNRLLSALSLIIALTALTHSLWLQSRTAASANEALRARELNLVRASAPKFSRIYEDMLGASFQPETFHPTTIEQLLTPLLVIIPQASTQTETQK
jgi:hypothetical protein